MLPGATLPFCQIVLVLTVVQEAADRWNRVGRNFHEVEISLSGRARRLGSPEVKMICLESRGEMPGFQWEVQVAEDEGIPIYVISTSEVNKDPISGNVFRRITARTGGRAFFAKTWQKQTEAFHSIREELRHIYTISYYPQANPNEGWRNIEVQLTGDAAKKYRVRTRAGYRPKSML